jgi:hypothetical protein
MVDQARSAGMSDVQIEDEARRNHIPEWLIAWAKKRCAPRKPLTPG